jgi:hypothetical protein
MRAPFLSARVNVVLYRERYGKTPWTGVELKAIQDSCLQTLDGLKSLGPMKRTTLLIGCGSIN